MPDTTTTPEPIDRLAYSIPQSEQALGVSHTVIYELIKAGELQTYTVGRRRFCSHKALVDFINRREAAEVQGAA